MSDLLSLWTVFKDSTVLQAVLGALVGFVVMQLFQRRAASADAHSLPGLRGQAVPTPDDFLLGQQKPQAAAAAKKATTASSTSSKKTKKKKEAASGGDSDDTGDEEAARIRRRQRRRRRSPGDGDAEEASSDASDASALSDCDDAEPEFVPYHGVSFGEEEMLRRAHDFCQVMRQRRSCRHFSDRPVPRQLVQSLIQTAASAPSGANTQPWTYVLVSEPSVKRRIRDIVEEEEEMNYARRMGPEWRADVAKMGTSWEKPYITQAPYVVVLLRQVHGLRSDGRRRRHYYSELSVGISAGLLVAAVQNAGLCTVTTTPMNAGTALRRLLRRPPHERVVLLLPVGYPADGALVPRLQRKDLDRVLVEM